MFRSFFTFLVLTASAIAAPVHLVDEAPVSIQRIDQDTILVEFDRVSFGNIQLTPPAVLTPPEWGVVCHSAGWKSKAGRAVRS